jgi:enoyl-CoA hydratase/carnithine racemase
MGYENILTERVDSIAVITMNRPEKLNALSYELACELDEELKRIESDDAVRVVILTGAGPRAFSAGGDIMQMVKSTPEEMAARSEIRREANWHLATFSKPIIGAINGLAYGAGAQMTTMLDLRIGCEHAEIQFLAAKYGRANSTWSLPLIVGLPKAKELLYTGRPVKAEEAERIGLLNQIVPCAQLREASLAMAGQIAENDPRMVQGIKQLLTDGIGAPWRERFDAEQNARKGKLKANSPREGFKAFLERKGIR